MFVPIGVASKMVGVCTKTLMRWEREEIIVPRRTVGGHRRYDKDALGHFIKTGVYVVLPTGSENIAVYARVSAQKQKEDLRRLVGFLADTVRERTGKTVLEYSDIGSGLNDERKGLLKLMSDAAAGKFGSVYVTYSDRLARFGTKVIVKALETYGVGFKSIHVEEKRDLQSQIVDDIVALMHSFSGKLYRLRRGKNNVGVT
jgi:putative resolvase